MSSLSAFTESFSSPLARVHLGDLRVELLAERELAPQIGPARRAGRRRADEAARVPPRRAEDADDEPGRFVPDDRDLHGLVEHDPLRSLVRRVARGGRVEADLVIPDLEVDDDHFDRVALLHDLARVLDPLQR